MNVLTKPQKNNLFNLTNVVSNIDVIQGFHKKENRFIENNFNFNYNKMCSPCFINKRVVKISHIYYIEFTFYQMSTTPRDLFSNESNKDQRS